MWEVPGAGSRRAAARSGSEAHGQVLQVRSKHAACSASCTLSLETKALPALTSAKCCTVISVYPMIGAFHAFHTSVLHGSLDAGGLVGCLAAVRYVHVVYADNAFLPCRFRGVSKKKGKWEAKVMVNRKWAYRELFDSEEEAARAYDDAVWRLKPKEAKSYINFKERFTGDRAPGGRLHRPRQLSALRCFTADLPLHTKYASLTLVQICVQLRQALRPVMKPLT